VKDYLNERGRRILRALDEVAARCRSTPARVALAWLLGRPGITSVIIGARTDEQLADNLAAAELELSDDEAARLEEVSRPPLLYPFWHQRKTASDRLSDADLSLLAPYLAPSPAEALQAAN
jgi:diketogulonate reductase-like aldo/keto reductase